MPDSEAPAATKRPQTLTTHGDLRVDEWHWLRDKDNPEVLAHLRAENAYTESVMAETAALQQVLYDEIVGRIQETDFSVPVRKGPWWYLTRTEEGKQYSIHLRRPDVDGEPAGDEQVLLDENIEAGDGKFFDTGAFDVSPDGRLLAYSVDRSGDELFDMRIRDLATGVDLPDVIEQTYYGTAWAGDGSVLFYTRTDDAHRPHQVWRHRIGTGAEADELVFEEADERFFVGLSNSKTDDFVMVGSSSSLTSEMHVLRSDDPMGELSVVEQRRQGVEYAVSHHRSAEHGDRFFVLTNEDAPNFRLMVTPADEPGQANWTTVIEHDPLVKLDAVEPFTGHLVLSERAEAVTRLSVIDLAVLTREVMPQDEPIYTSHSVGNAEFDSTVLRYQYTSLVSPRTVYDVDLVSGERTLRKQQPALGGYEPEAYTTKRAWAAAPDGTQVPISLVQRRDREGAGPALLYGYGSYEISIDPTFSSLRLSLLDRGFVFAIAHIRGGGDMGRLWYEHGKFFDKRNTFTDFIACAEHLVAEGLTTPDQLVIRGGSAGGLLMGAVTNQRPDLVAAVVAEVPFVDCLTTMLDPSLPLTVHEYEEWGNPGEPEVYSYMLSYSPYDNVAAQRYPTMLVTAGLNDPRVAYWEPAKWVQRLRDRKTDDGEVLLKTEMGAGHKGPSGRYDAWRDESFVYAFILRALGMS